MPDHATLRALINAIPNDHLRDVIIALVIGGQAIVPTTPGEPSPAPQPVKRGWPKGVPRKPKSNGASAVNLKLTEQRRQRYNERRRAKRHAAAKANTPKIKPTPPQRRPDRPRNGAPISPAKPASNGATTGQVSGEVFWAHAEKLAPTRPWTAVAKQLGCNLAVAQDAHRMMKLPPNVNEAAAARFLMVSAN